MKQLRKRPETGSALVLAAVAFVLMAGIGAALFSLAMAGSKATLAASNSDLAYNVAEAGIDDAINKMKAYYAKPGNTSADYAVIGVVLKDKEGNTYNEVVGTFNDGTYTVIIEPPYAGVGEYRITATGTANRETRGIVTWLSADEDSSIFKYGLFGDVYTDAGGNIKTDGYHSANGSYVSQAKNTVGGVAVANKTGHVGSNGAVSVSGSSFVYGNATPGPNSTVTGGGTVYGSKTPAKNTMALPTTDFTMPNTAVSVKTITGSTSITGSATLGSAGGTNVYSAVNVSPNGKNTITIKGDVTLYVSGDFVFTGQSNIVLDTGAKLTIYQSATAGKLQVNGGSLVNTSLIPDNMKIYSQTANATYNGNADWYGSIYAPTTALKLSGTAGFFGSAIAKTIDIQGTPFFHYDEAMEGVKSSTITFSVKAVEQFIP